MKVNTSDAGVVTSVELNQPERKTLRNAVGILEQVGFHLRGSACGERLIAAGETASKLLADTQPSVTVVFDDDPSD